MITSSKYDGGFWIRLCGYGISIVDKTKNPPLFSERIGKRKVLRVGKYGIELLRRENPLNNEGIYGQHQSR